MPDKFVGIDLATRPKGRVGLPQRALIGGAQPVWLVGPRRPRYIEEGWGPGHGTRSSPPPEPTPQFPIDLGLR